MYEGESSVKFIIFSLFTRAADVVWGSVLLTLKTAGVQQASVSLKMQQRTNTVSCFYHIPLSFLSWPIKIVHTARDSGLQVSEFIVILQPCAYMDCSSDRLSIMPPTWKSGEMFCLLRSVLLQCHGVSIKGSRGIERSEIVVVMWCVFWLHSLKLFLQVRFSRDPCTVNLQSLRARLSSNPTHYLER